MFCPICHTEYVPGIDVCSDCGSGLVPVLPAHSENEPFALVWSGSDPRRHEEVRSVLEKKGFPVRSVRREDYLVYVPRYSEFELHVPAPRLPEAKGVLADSGMLDKDWRDLEERDVFELPEGESSHVTDAPLDPLNWPAEEATVEIWSGDDLDLARMITASLRENGIGSRLDPTQPGEGEEPEEPAMRKVFVLPDNATRAREIVREISEATPPQ